MVARGFSGAALSSTARSFSAFCRVVHATERNSISHVLAWAVARSPFKPWSFSSKVFTFSSVSTSRCLASSSFTKFVNWQLGKISATREDQCGKEKEDAITRQLSNRDQILGSIVHQHLESCVVYLLDEWKAEDASTEHLGVGPVRPHFMMGGQ
ncbi:hypothetical protein B296_00016228 [Ensete ventricosum]|uniref:Uncharacterized protein n=1 Tax=Ensete ventricosum TaxID=4639 RepID=A0A426Z8A2_ENSVE|nr:hypothetical protein B296_00016228 [Ensete ventricosum]